jgi:hypothetical protein
VRFLIDADLPRSTAALLRRYGHEPMDVRDVGLGGAEDPVIAARAQAETACLLTGDFGFADIRNYPPGDYAGIAVLELPKHATADFILKLIENFVGQPEVLRKLPGRLAIVASGRVRLRPA